ncbi:hypothetical protein mmcaprivi_09670 [Mycoplasma mycoides]|nr:hypothetical protein mmcaprivi_09670 [Mycoplasma mycoides]
MGFLYVQIRFRKKLKIVKEAKKLNVKRSTYLANKYNTSDWTVKNLVNRFEAFGIEGLINKDKNLIIVQNQNSKLYYINLKLISLMMKLQENLMLFIHQLQLDDLKSIKNMDF